MVFLLQRESFHAVTTPPGLNLLKEAREQQPHLVILEENPTDLPGMAAWQLLQADPLTAHIPLIVTTKRVLEDESLDDKIAFLTKPLETKLLLLTINRMLFPLPQKDEFVNLVESTGIVRWEAKVLLADRKYITLVRQNWRPEMDSLFRPGEACGLERILKDRTILRYEGNLAEIGADYVRMAVKGPIERSQQRQFLRKSVELHVRYRLPGEFYRLTRTIDLSGGGARLAEVPSTLKVGDVFEAAVILPSERGKEINLHSILRWVRPLNQQRQEAGVAFADITPEQRRKILDFLYHL